jgi:transmembrane sensor
VSDLLERVRRAAGGAQPNWTPERAAANELAIERLGQRHRRLRRTFAASISVATVAVVLATLSLWFPRRREVVRYADGTTAVPTTSSAQLTVTTVTPTLVRSELARGGYRFKVVHDPARIFRVGAGKVQVEVLGTEFIVDRLNDEHVRIEVLSGRVRVSSGDERVELASGEVGMFPRPVDATAKPAVDAAVDEPAARPTMPTKPSTGLVTKRSWVRLAQAGDYEAAYDALKRAREPVKGPVELMLASDAARLSRHPLDALAPLESVVASYPHDPRAPLAAFTLGRVLLDDLGRPGVATTAFARARSLAPAGAIAEDALAREVEAWFRSGDLARAHDRATEYVSQYPTGTRLRSVRRFGGID